MSRPKSRIQELSRDFPGIVLTLNLMLTVIFGLVSSYWMEREFAFMSALVVWSLLTLFEVSLAARRVEARLRAIEPTMTIGEIADPAIRDAVVRLAKSAQIAAEEGRALSDGGSGLGEVYRTAVVDGLGDALARVQAVERGALRLLTDEKPRFWQDLVTHVSHSFLTTNYSTQGGSYGRSNSDSLLELQRQAVVRMKARNGRGLQRIFVLPEGDAIPSGELLDLMRAQRGVGVGVKWIEHAHFASLGARNNWFERIGSPDFTILDGTLLYVTHLKDGHVKSVELTNDSLRVACAAELWGILSNEAKLLDLQEEAQSPEMRELDAKSGE